MTTFKKLGLETFKSVPVAKTPCKYALCFEKEWETLLCELSASEESRVHHLSTFSRTKGRGFSETRATRSTFPERDQAGTVTERWWPGPFSGSQ